jgi:hypothetical protein
MLETNVTSLSLHLLKKLYFGYICRMALKVKPIKALFFAFILFGFCYAKYLLISSSCMCLNS